MYSGKFLNFFKVFANTTKEDPISKLYKQFLHYTIPSVAAMIVFTIYTMVDGFFVARFVGEYALSSVNIALPFINGLFGIAILFSVGTQTLVGVKLGQGDHDGANRLFSFVSSSIVVFCFLLTLLCSLFIEDIALFLGTTDILRENVLCYLRIITLFSSCFILSYNFEVLVKIDGFPLLATLSVIVSATTNIALDYVFVGLWGYGVPGAALATGISQAVSIIIYLYHFTLGKSTLRFVRYRPAFSIFKKIIPLGLGDFISEIGVGIIIFLYNHFLLYYDGELAVASFTVIGYLNQIVCMCYVGIMQGIQPLVSFYLGKGESATYKKLFQYALQSIGVLSVVFLLLVFFYAPAIATLFFDDTKTLLIDKSILAMRFFSLAFLFSGFNILVAGFSSALLRAKYAILINLLRNFVFLALSLSVLGYFFGSTGLWFASALAELSCILLSAICLKNIWRE